jgi:hypothetical protein
VPTLHCLHVILEEELVHLHIATRDLEILAAGA